MSDGDDPHEIIESPNGGSEPSIEPPEITDVAPNSGRPGTPITITGTLFGSVTEVTFSGLAGRAGASFRRTSITTLAATVPSLPPGEFNIVVVSSQNGPSFPWRDFVIPEFEPPGLSSVGPGAAFPGDQIRLAGSRFGEGMTSTGAVLVGGTPAPVISWRAGEIVAVVPDLPSGPKDVVVTVPWGSSSPRPLTVLSPPALSGLSPQSGVADAEVRLTGSAFGSAPGTVVIGAARAHVTEWTDTRITARVPGLARMQAWGPTGAAVTTALGRTSNSLPFTVLERASITSWTRLEPHARTEDLEAGLELGMAARVHDGLWFLARQWQLGEFQGEDAATPVLATVQAEVAKVARWRAGRGPSTAPLVPLPAAPSPLPLETLVERDAAAAAGQEAASWRMRFRVESGVQFLRLLAFQFTDAPKRERYKRAYRDAYPLPAAPGSGPVDDETTRFLEVARGRAADGAAFAAALRSALPAPRGTGTLPAQPPIDAADQPLVKQAVVQWFDWYDGLASEAAAGAASAWDTERMEYAFAVAAQTTSHQLVLEAPEHSEGHLDWHSFTVSSRPPDTTAPAPAPLTTTVAPAPVSYPGMPAARWWEMEDAAVDFGGIEPGVHDLARMMLVEFAVVFGNDWFVVPVPGVPVGSVVRLRSLRVTDTFGQAVDVRPFASGTRATGPWRMFELTRATANDAVDVSELLFVPPTLVASLHSPPLEEVRLLRDEMANMAWAVERVVESASGRPFDRGEAWRRDARSQVQGAISPLGAPHVYRLATTVPDHWLPLVPDADRPGRLRRDGVPMGRVMRPGTPLSLYDEEVPRAGALVTRGYQYTRWVDGSTHLWIARKKHAGSGEGRAGCGSTSCSRRCSPYRGPRGPAAPAVRPGSRGRQGREGGPAGQVRRGRQDRDGSSPPGASTPPATARPRRSSRGTYGPSP